MMSKSELIQKVADECSLAKKDVKAALEALASVGYKEMKKSGEFLLPGFAKFIVVKKPATKERTGINPFTKEPTVFKAKPARKMLKVHITQTIAYATDQLQGDYAKSIADYDEAEGHMLMLADQLSAGIIKEFPGRFR